MAPRRPQRRRSPTAATALGLSSLILPTFCLVRFTARTGYVSAILYTCVMSVATFLLYGYDKMQARNLEWRVKEATLHTMALLGGWPGALVGQLYFQHKTKKTSFQLVFWGIMLGWQFVWWVLWNEGIEGRKTLAKMLGNIEREQARGIERGQKIRS
ncbi:DUF1294-domain-containing protein [Lindgomyces ingoldianus]|uniref:DUF1294-domain-containing protein n=1 Tax=Lindgomyces ingoldianus TaxID=673940 RepID=A0ACB6QLK8_9PLEO|nr:DUF1294-domain-containing protein [Lindgomyces ingoldianus]KAF2467410.1 DUF1294-domain-containing protein [Lindgomyces ingoldianus]